MNPYNYRVKYGRGPKLEGCAFANFGNSSEAKTLPHLAPPTIPAAFPSPRLCHSARPAYTSPAPLPPHLHIARPAYNSPRLHLVRPAFTSPAYTCARLHLRPPSPRPQLTPQSTAFQQLSTNNCHHLHHLLIVGCIFSLLVASSHCWCSKLSYASIPIIWF